MKIALIFAVICITTSFSKPTNEYLNTLESIEAAFHTETIKENEKILAKRFISFSKMKSFANYLPFDFTPSISFSKILLKFTTIANFMGYDTSNLINLGRLYNSAFSTQNLLFKRRVLNLIVRTCNFIMGYLPEEPAELNQQLYQLNHIATNPRFQFNLNTIDDDEEVELQDVTKYTPDDRISNLIDFVTSRPEIYTQKPLVLVQNPVVVVQNPPEKIVTLEEIEGSPGSIEENDLNNIIEDVNPYPAPINRRSAMKTPVINRSPEIVLQHGLNKSESKLGIVDQHSNKPTSNHTSDESSYELGRVTEESNKAIKIKAPSRNIDEVVARTPESTSNDFKQSVPSNRIEYFAEAPDYYKTRHIEANIDIIPGNFDTEVQYVKSYPKYEITTRPNYAYKVPIYSPIPSASRQKHVDLYLNIGNGNNYEYDGDIIEHKDDDNEDYDLDYAGSEKFELTQLRPKRSAEEEEIPRRRILRRRKDPGVTKEQKDARAKELEAIAAVEELRIAELEVRAKEEETREKELEVRVREEAVREKELEHRANAEEPTTKKTVGTQIPRRRVLKRRKEQVKPIQEEDGRTKELKAIAAVEEARIKELETREIEEQVRADELKKRMKAAEEAKIAEEAARLKELDARAQEEIVRAKELEARAAEEIKRAKELEIRIAAEKEARAKELEARSKELEARAAEEILRAKELESRAKEEKARKDELAIRVKAEEDARLIELEARERELEARAVEEEARAKELEIRSKKEKEISKDLKERVEEEELARADELEARAREEEARSKELEVRRNKEKEISKDLQEEDDDLKDRLDEEDVSRAKELEARAREEEIRSKELEIRRNKQKEIAKDLEEEDEESDEAGEEIEDEEEVVQEVRTGNNRNQGQGRIRYNDSKRRTKRDIGEQSQDLGTKYISGTSVQASVVPEIQIAFNSDSISIDKEKLRQLNFESDHKELFNATEKILLLEAAEDILESNIDQSIDGNTGSDMNTSKEDDVAVSEKNATSGFTTIPEISDSRLSSLSETQLSNETPLILSEEFIRMNNSNKHNYIEPTLIEINTTLEELKIDKLTEINNDNSPKREATKLESFVTENTNKTSENEDDKFTIVFAKGPSEGEQVEENNIVYATNPNVTDFVGFKDEEELAQDIKHNETEELFYHDTAIEEIHENSLDETLPEEFDLEDNKGDMIAKIIEKLNKEDHMKIIDDSTNHRYILVKINKRLHQPELRNRRHLGTSYFSDVISRFRQISPNFEGFSNVGDYYRRPVEQENWEPNYGHNNWAPQQTFEGNDSEENVWHNEQDTWEGEENDSWNDNDEWNEKPRTSGIYPAKLQEDDSNFKQTGNGNGIETEPFNYLPTYDQTSNFNTEDVTTEKQDVQRNDYDEFKNLPLFEKSTDFKTKTLEDNFANLPIYDNYVVFENNHQHIKQLKNTANVEKLLALFDHEKFLKSIPNFQFPNADIKQAIPLRTSNVELALYPAFSENVNLNEPKTVGLTEADAVAKLVLPIFEKQTPFDAIKPLPNLGKIDQLFAQVDAIKPIVYAQEIPILTEEEASRLTHVYESKIFEFLNSRLPQPISLIKNVEVPTLTSAEAFKLSQEHSGQILAAINAVLPADKHFTELKVVDINTGRKQITNNFDTLTRVATASLPMSGGDVICVRSKFETANKVMPNFNEADVFKMLEEFSAELDYLRHVHFNSAKNLYNTHPLQSKDSKPKPLTPTINYQIQNRISHDNNNVQIENQFLVPSTEAYTNFKTSNAFLVPSVYQQTKIDSSKNLFPSQRPTIKINPNLKGFLVPSTEEDYSNFKTSNKFLIPSVYQQTKIYSSKNSFPSQTPIIKINPNLKGFLVPSAEDYSNFKTSNKFLVPSVYQQTKIYSSKNSFPAQSPTIKINPNLNGFLVPTTEDYSNFKTSNKFLVPSVYQQTKIYSSKNSFPSQSPTIKINPNLNGFLVPSTEDYSNFKTSNRFLVPSVYQQTKIDSSKNLFPSQSPTIKINPNLKGFLVPSAAEDYSNFKTSNKFLIPSVYQQTKIDSSKNLFSSQSPTIEINPNLKGFLVPSTQDYSNFKTSDTFLIPSVYQQTKIDSSKNSFPSQTPTIKINPNLKGFLVPSAAEDYSNFKTSNKFLIPSVYQQTKIDSSKNLFPSQSPTIEINPNLKGFLVPSTQDYSNFKTSDTFLIPSVYQQTKIDSSKNSFPSQTPTIKINPNLKGFLVPSAAEDYSNFKTSNKFLIPSVYQQTKIDSSKNLFPSQSPTIEINPNLKGFLVPSTQDYSNFKTSDTFLIPSVYQQTKIDSSKNSFPSQTPTIKINPNLNGFLVPSTEDYSNFKTSDKFLVPSVYQQTKIYSSKNLFPSQSPTIKINPNLKGFLVPSAEDYSSFKTSNKFLIPSVYQQTKIDSFKDAFPSKVPQIKINPKLEGLVPTTQENNFFQAIKQEKTNEVGTLQNRFIDDASNVKNQFLVPSTQDYIDFKSSNTFLVPSAYQQTKIHSFTDQFPSPIPNIEINPNIKDFLVPITQDYANFKTSNKFLVPSAYEQTKINSFKQAIPSQVPEIKIDHNLKEFLIPLVKEYENFKTSNVFLVPSAYEQTKINSFKSKNPFQIPTIKINDSSNEFLVPSNKDYDNFKDSNTFLVPSVYQQTKINSFKDQFPAQIPTIKINPNLEGFLVPTSQANNNFQTSTTHKSFNDYKSLTHGELIKIIETETGELLTQMNAKLSPNDQIQGIKVFGSFEKNENNFETGAGDGLQETKATDEYFKNIKGLNKFQAMLLIRTQAAEIIKKINANLPENKQISDLKIYEIINSTSTKIIGPENIEPKLRETTKKISKLTMNTANLESRLGFKENESNTTLITLNNSTSDSIDDVPLIDIRASFDSLDLPTFPDEDLSVRKLVEDVAAEAVSLNQFISSRHDDASKSSTEKPSDLISQILIPSNSKSATLITKEFANANLNPIYQILAPSKTFNSNLDVQPSSADSLSKPGYNKVDATQILIPLDSKAIPFNTNHEQLVSTDLQTRKVYSSSRGQSSLNVLTENAVPFLSRSLKFNTPINDASKIFVPSDGIDVNRFTPSKIIVLSQRQGAVPPVSKSLPVNTKPVTSDSSDQILIPTVSKSLISETRNVAPSDLTVLTQRQGAVPPINSKPIILQNPISNDVQVGQILIPSDFKTVAFNTNLTPNMQKLVSTKLESVGDVHVSQILVPTNSNTDREQLSPTNSQLSDFAASDTLFQINQKIPSPLQSTQFTIKSNPTVSSLDSNQVLQSVVPTLNDLKIIAAPRTKLVTLEKSISQQGVETTSSPFLSNFASFDSRASRTILEDVTQNIKATKSDGIAKAVPQYVTIKLDTSASALEDSISGEGRKFRGDQGAFAKRETEAY